MHSQAHKTLNRLITSRLPVALPPETKTPRLYLTGLLHFATVYITFESLWSIYLSCIPPNTPPGLPSPDYDTVSKPQPGASSSRYKSILQSLHLPHLKRSNALRADLADLSGSSPATVEIKLLNPEAPCLKEFRAHIQEATDKKPYLLLAYAWVMYMAIFSGGRWVRAQLLSAGENFWSQDQETGRDSTSGSVVGNMKIPKGLEFLHFRDSLVDGEDLRSDFKLRFFEAESRLSENERDDIVREAQNIFKFLTMMVEELDGLVGDVQVPGGVRGDVLPSRPLKADTLRLQQEILFLNSTGALPMPLQTEIRGKKKEVEEGKPLVDPPWHGEPPGFLLTIILAAVGLVLLSLGLRWIQ